MTELLPFKFVSFDEYIDVKPNALPLDSLGIDEPYMAVLRRKEATSSIFALALVGFIKEVDHQESYSVVTFALMLNAGLTSLEAGINRPGIVFKHSPLPARVDPVAFEAERGYFLGNNGELNGYAEIPEAAGTKVEHEELHDNLASSTLSRIV